MRPVLEPLAAVDEANLVLDHPGQVNVFLLAGLLAPGGFLAEDGTADMAALRDALRERVASVPALCRIALGRGRRHRWASVVPDLEQHIRLAAPVQGLDGLERMCGALMDEPLAPGRPLWELLVVPGVADARARSAIVLRIHHVLADGMTAVSIAQRLFEADPDDERGAAGDGRAAPVAPVERLPLLRRAAASLARVRITLLGGGVGPTLLLGPRSADRGVALLRFDLGRLLAGARARGATVNDALLAGAAAGLCAALEAGREEIPDSLAVSVPVALPRRGRAANQVGVMLVPLPLWERDLDERLRRIAALTRPRKRSARTEGTLELMRGPLGARFMDRLGARQRLVASFLTNVRGPASGLRLGGAPLVAAWPVAVLAGNVRVGVAAISYRGGLWCSVHFDAEHVAGAAFARAMRAEIERLIA